MGGRRVRVKTKGFIKPLALGGVKGLSSCAEGEGAEGEGGGMGGRRERAGL